MTRFQIYLPEPLLVELTRRARNLGVSVAEVIRVLLINAVKADDHGA